MACNDCEDCVRHENYGGKCTRWEYDCPFRNLSNLNESQRKKIKETISIVKNVKCDMKDMDYIDNLDYIMSLYNTIIDELECLVDIELLKEWEEINK